MQTRLSQPPYTRDKVEKRSKQKSGKDLWALPRACVSGASRQELAESKALRHRRRQGNESTRTARVPTAVLNNLPAHGHPTYFVAYVIMHVWRMGGVAASAVTWEGPKHA